MRPSQPLGNNLPTLQYMLLQLVGEVEDIQSKRPDFKKIYDKH